MNSIYRDPNIEEGLRNLIFQSRAGNRLTLMFHEHGCELEFVYKPSAFRRKDFRARNFSNRDNFTRLFQVSALPDITAASVKRWAYDPFITTLDTAHPSGAKNSLTVIALPEENAFALAARAPLTLTFVPHHGFEVQDGLLTESFEDRGEEITSFIAFDSLERNRYRVLNDGSHVLQIFENEVLLVGGEDCLREARRVARRYSHTSLSQLKEQTEESVAPVLGVARTEVADSRLQRVLDLNRRLTWSALDDGGACFGALNRVYHLIWVRDGSMSTSYLAAAGNPEFCKRWAPLLLANPSISRPENGPAETSFSQLVGSPWSKAEDDGLYYAVLSLYWHTLSTGDNVLLNSTLSLLRQSLDAHIASQLDPDRGLFGSDTRGESTLASSPYYGYDIVNGEFDKWKVGTEEGGKPLSRVYSLYHNVNIFNALRMTDVLLAWSGQPPHYHALADTLAQRISTAFADDQGTFWSDFAIFADGSEEKTPFSRGDYWEYAWAVSCGPFYPDLPRALRSARHVAATWATIRPYGYCPWNMIARMLREFGGTDASFASMLSEQLDDALRLTTKYPMPGLLTEYQSQHDGWRGLPFQTGTLVLATTGLLLHSLPMGIAVRGSSLVSVVHQYRRRDIVLDATASGPGEHPGRIILNGDDLLHTLQLPEALLRPGHNILRIHRSAAPPPGPRLFSSTALLLSVTATGTSLTFRFQSPVPGEALFENLASSNLPASLRPHATPLEDTRLTRVLLPAAHTFDLILSL